MASLSKQDIIYVYFGLKYNREMFSTGTRVQVTTRLSTANYFYLWCHVVMLSEPSHAPSPGEEGVLWEELHVYAHFTLILNKLNPDIQHQNVDMPVWQPLCRRHFVVMWHIDSLWGSHEVTLSMYMCIYIYMFVDSEINEWVHLEQSYVLLTHIEICNTTAQVVLLNKTPILP